MSNGMSVRQCEGAATYFKEHGELPEGEVVAKPKSKKSKNKEPKNGSPKKGKMTISYANEEELERLVAILELRS
ncbi:ParB/RepB/Spo0J family partition protein [Aduncisulcus paluster]|uniref:ParB/RepB/Spo0J family partition protein n=1 Tax=Aduncisulcus paluster TaxID=2918883 RepID=A0ABQ5KFT3_9EUKA|nr:ParB/RepB/Spo0J family partition protein [Aduncisulcus paluster]